MVLVTLAMLMRGVRWGGGDDNDAGNGEEVAVALLMMLVVMLVVVMAMVWCTWCAHAQPHLHCARCLVARIKHGRPWECVLAPVIAP